MNHQVTDLYHPPPSIALWHCTDPSCEAFHSVYLEEGSTIYLNILEDIRDILSEEKPSDYYRFFHDLINADDHYYDINRVHETPLLILNCFNEDELRELLKHLINSDKTLRSKFPSDKRLQGQSMAIVNQLSKAECAQLLLLSDGKLLITCLEEVIDSQIIHIPSTEIRESSLKVAGGFYDVYHQCNSLGIRSIPSYQNICIVRLLDMIEKVHATEESRTDLEWKLMAYKKGSFRETLENLLLHEDPKVIVKDTLLYGPRQTQKVLELLYGNFATPSSEDEKNSLVNKVLWKLGFDINLYPTTLQSFWEKLQSFKKVVGECSNSFGDGEKESIRSVGVNFFVLLEEVLERTLAYETWLLLSDHFLSTKFQFTFEEARDFMCDKLNGQKVGSGETLRFDKTGNNTLFPLVEGFIALTNMCDERLSQPSTDFQKDESDIPHFHEATDLTIFPFPSKVFLLDIKAREYEELKSYLVELHREFTKHQVLSIRNRLEHKERDKKILGGFPSKEQILSCIDCIDAVFKKFEEKGVYPNVFLFKSYSNDFYNRVRYDLQDYKGNIRTIKPIPQFRGCKLPEYRIPQLISSIFTVGNSSEPLRFKFEEQSVYLQFWKGFPRRRVTTSTLEE